MSEVTGIAHEAGDSKWEIILLVAKELFLDAGYAATSMDQVASRARVSKTTLYTRFPSKETLFAAVVSAHNQTSTMHFAPSELADLSIDDALYEIGERFVDLVCTREALRFDIVVHNEATRFPELVDTFRRNGPERTFATVEAYLRDASKRGLIEVPDFRFAAMQFLISMRGYPYAFPPSRYLSQTEPSKGVRIRKAVAFFLNGVRSKGRGATR